MSLEHSFPSGITNVIPAGFIEYLCGREPMLKSLTPKQQYGIARIVWTRYNKPHQHRKYPQYYSIHCRELEALLGRDYKHVYSMLGLLDQKAQWSIENHVTYAYDLLPRWNLWRGQFLNDVFKNGTTSELVGETRKKIQRRQNGIMSRDKGHSTAKTKASLPFAVRVNLNAMNEAIAYLSGQIARPVHLHYLQNLPPDRKARIKRELLELWALAHSTIVAVGEIPHEYIEVDSGRLFGRGQHLQNACREVKAIALSRMGLEEYDFSNCHFAIFAQLAGRAGSHCPVIDDYLNRKQTVRGQMAKDIGEEVEVIKQCLLMTLYGSNASCPRSEITSMLNPAELDRLRQNPIFMDIHEEIKRGRRAILKQARKGCLPPIRWHRGELVNVMNKSLKSGGKAEQLAHILQGYEAKLLNIVLEHYSPQLRLLQHDGFVSSVPIDVKMICGEIQRETGLVMQLEKAILEGVNKIV